MTGDAHSFDMAGLGSALFHRLEVSALKRLFSQYCTHDALNLCGGLPLPSVFPLQSLDFSLGEDSLSLRADSDLHLNYMRGDGVRGLKEWIQRHMETLHPAPRPFATCMSVGATDSVAKVFELFRGDCVLFDSFAYNTSLAACKAIGRQCIGVRGDDEGMLPEALREQTLLARQLGLHPDMVYLVPTAQNPLGVTMSDQRKRAIYLTCRELGLVIIEDGKANLYTPRVVDFLPVDAYYYLSFDDDAIPGVTGLPKSLLSMDSDGRVVRIDTVSKFIAPGFRLGWVSGPPEFVSKYQILQEMTGQFACGISQSIFLGMVTSWGEVGLDFHLRQVQSDHIMLLDVMDGRFNCTTFGRETISVKPFALS